MNTVHYPRVDPFTAEAERAAEAEPESVVEAVRTAGAAIAAERDRYYTELFRLRNEVAQLRQFIRDVQEVTPVTTAR